MFTAEGAENAEGAAVGSSVSMGDWGLFSASSASSAVKNGALGHAGSFNCAVLRLSDQHCP